MSVMSAVSRDMEITGASVLDLQALTKLERICFGEDAWPFLDLVAAGVAVGGFFIAIYTMIVEPILRKA